MLADRQKSYAIRMLHRTGWTPSAFLPALLLASLLACTASSTREAQTPVLPLPAPSPTAATVTATTTTTATATAEAGTATTTATRTATANPTATSVPRPAPQAEPPGIRASRLAIPSLGIDSAVQTSQVIPDTSPPTPGCPPTPPGSTTFTVPDQGIATPVDGLEGLENKAWIFGHSRWLGQPGVLFSLQNINVGDELLVDGVDRATGARITRQRFVVSGLYLTDIDSGGKLVTAGSPAEIPAKPVVILQTSVREDGANRQWILDQQTVLAKSRNLIEGDMNDPCKYLLLFVFAQSS